MNQIRSGDAELTYGVIGQGRPLVLLHPFPVHHDFWQTAAPILSTRYRLILPDLRGHGESTVGDGPATMEKHAGDIVRICEQEGIGRAAFAGVSIGGYTLFEFWRRYRDRVALLALCNTKAQAETSETRSARLKAAADVLERGTEPFIEGMVPKVFSRTTIANRPDLVDTAKRMMRKMSPTAVNLVQKGMAERPDSVPTLKTITVPTLIMGGDDDAATPLADAELMRQNIPGAELKIVAHAGHYAVLEQPQAAGAVLRQFLDNHYTT